MKLSNQGLRKAAILVASLDMAAADTVLDELSAEQAQRVREIVMEMGDVDRAEQQRVIDEFFRVGAMIPARNPPGIELDGRMARIHVPLHGIEPDPRPEIARDGGVPFRFLQETESDKLARALGGERPQTIALVLSHLPPGRAGGVLARLQPDLQVEVIRRLVDLEETDPEILREVEEALQSRMSQQVEMQRRRVAGLQAVAGILEATGGSVGMQILDNLAARDQSLAERLGPRAIDFDDLSDLDDETLQAVFDTAGSDLMIPALVGASSALISRVLAAWPAAEAVAIRRQLDFPGPLRLRDVEDARQQIAQLASRMVYGSERTLARAA